MIAETEHKCKRFFKKLLAFGTLPHGAAVTKTLVFCKILISFSAKTGYNKRWDGMDSGESTPEISIIDRNEYFREVCWLRICNDVFISLWSFRMEDFMKGRISNKMGEILIDEDVIAKYAGSTAVECFGIVGMATVNMKEGLVKLLKKESLTNGITIAIHDNKLTIDFHVIVSYGVSIQAVADNLFSSVKYQVEEFTGMEIEKINMYVEGVRVID